MHRRAFSALLISGAAIPWQAWSQPAPHAAQSEESRLAAFFQKADEERLNLSPEAMTFRGIKKRYGELGDHSRASDEQYVALSARQVAQMKKQFNRAGLSPAAQLSYDLFERLATMSQAHFAWY